MRNESQLRSIGSKLLLILLVFAGAVNAAALEVPRLKGHVNDYAAMLSTASERQLEAVLTDFEQKESTQIVVLTVPSLQGDSIEAFSMRVVEAWKIGQKKLVRVGGTPYRSAGRANHPQRDCAAIQIRAV
jgi:uncharacterized protein